MIWDMREYESVDSTNLEARRILEAGGGEAGLVIRAHHQTAGRGRLDRAWHDLPGKSLIVSLVLPAMDGFRVGVLVATSIRGAIVEAGGTGPSFKWPNDLVYDWRKVGGILSESCRLQEASYVITGLGLNVAYSRGELDIDAKLAPTSLLIEEGRDWDVKGLLRAFLHQIRRGLVGDWPDSLAEYRDNLAYAGEHVRIGQPYSVLGEAPSGEGFLEGILEGVDDRGHLLVRVENRMLELAAGDIEPL